MASRPSSSLCVILAAFLAWPWIMVGFPGTEDDATRFSVTSSGSARIIRVQRPSPVESPSVATTTVGESDDEEGEGPHESPVSMAMAALTLEGLLCLTRGERDPGARPLDFAEAQHSRRLRC